MKTNKTSGVAIVEVFLLLVFVGLFASLGYVYFTNSTKISSNTGSQDSSQSSVAPPAEEVSTIDSTSDLDAALAELNALEIDDSSDESSLKNIESSL